MNGPEILNFALKEVPNSIVQFLRKNKLKITEVDKFIFHQANKFIIKSLQQKLFLPDEKVIIEMNNSGNTVSSSIPIALKKIENKINKNEKILLIGFGGGLSWGVGLIQKC